jgi:hypothetical protein
MMQAVVVDKGYMIWPIVLIPNNYNEIWLGGVNTWATDDGGLNFYPMTMWNA